MTRFLRGRHPGLIGGSMLRPRGTVAEAAFRTLTDTRKSRNGRTEMFCIRQPQGGQAFPVTQVPLTMPGSRRENHTSEHASAYEAGVLFLRWQQSILKWTEAIVANSNNKFLCL